MVKISSKNHMKIQKKKKRFSNGFFKLDFN